MSSEAGQAVETEVEESEEVAPRMALRVEIRDVGACRKHVSVTVPEADIATIRGEALGELAEKAQVPGFRVGKVPRGLLEKRFKTEISADIKQKVLLASLEQLSDENDIEPISEPKIDVEGLDIPDVGDFHYEFDVEVRPDFELPDYAGITITRSSGETTDEEFQAFRTQFLTSYAERLTTDDAAAAGDYVLCDITFTHEGRQFREVRGQSFRLLPQLNFQDAVLNGFDSLMAGAKAGDIREATVQISLQSPVVEMRGEKIMARFEVQEVQQVRMPTIDKEFCERMSADTVNVADSGSSVSKGETLVDTARNLEAMRIDMVVVRHGASGAARFLAERIESNVINAGDGTHEHPTQGLLDLLTLRQRFGSLKGRRVCIVGDVLHSRVARSNIWGLKALGADVAVCGPRSLLPNAIGEMGVQVFNRVEAAIEWAEALNVLRLQLERMQRGYIPSLREYNRVFGVTSARLAASKRDLLILHPGPMNRGVEIDSDVADGPHSVILDQVTNGIAVRMAVLYLLAGNAPALADAAKGESV